MKWYRLLYSASIFSLSGVFVASFMRYFKLYSGEMAEKISHLVADPNEKILELGVSYIVGLLILGFVTYNVSDNVKIKSIFKEDLDSLMRIALSSSIGFSLYGLILFWGNTSDEIGSLNVVQITTEAIIILFASIFALSFYTAFCVKDDVENNKKISSDKTLQIGKDDNANQIKIDTSKEELKEKIKE